MPKNFDPSSRSYPLDYSQNSSSTESPTSTRANSVSPSAITASTRTPPRSLQILASANWDQSMLMQETDTLPTSSTSSYQLPPVSALSSKSLQYPPYPSSMPGSSRGSISNAMYIASSQPSYPHSTDRPMATAYSNFGFMTRNDIRDDSPQHEEQFSYAQTQFTPAHDSGMHSHGPSNAAASLHAHPQRDQFNHRRASTEPGTQSFRTITNQFPHLPNPAHGSMRVSPLPRLQDSGNPLGAAYDGRLNTMS